MTMSRGAESVLEAQVADRYRALGYTVSFGPGRGDLPFDLGSYHPDMIAIRGDDRVLIEVKLSGRQEPLDHLVEAAQIVRQHLGWRLVLVTPDDVSAEMPEADGRALPTWAEFHTELDRIAAVEAAGGSRAGILLAWSLVEGMLRRRCLDENLPLARLPTSVLLRQMSSQGELGVHQYDELMRSWDVRNQLAHGYAAADVRSIDQSLRAIAAELLREWEPAGSAA